MLYSCTHMATVGVKGLNAFRLVAMTTDSGKVMNRIVFTARCTLVQSAVLRSHVVCPSVCNVGEL